jgi:hypothetical protein
MIKNPSYRIYETPNKVIAVSSFAGQTVRGVAKCNPADEFDFDKGAALAAARCSAKIAEKRMKRAYTKVDEAKAQLDAAISYYSEMLKYQSDAEATYNIAQFELESTLAWICDNSNCTCGEDCECHCHD